MSTPLPYVSSTPKEVSCYLMQSYLKVCTWLAEEAVRASHSLLTLVSNSIYDLKHRMRKFTRQLLGAVVVVIVWQLDLQLPVQSVPITTTSCEFESRLWRGILDTILCDKVCQWLATGRLFSLGTPISSTNTTDRHDITEIVLKVSLNTIN